MLVLSNQDILTLFEPVAAIAAVAEAALAMRDSRTASPQRQHMSWEDNTLLLMPARASQWLSVKLVSVVPGNAGRGLPVTNGTLLLNDGVTGLPLCLMNAEQLTAVRTGAVGALAIRLTTPDSLNSLGIIGCGMQGAWQAIFACAVRPIEEIFYCAKSEQRERWFVDTVHRYVPTVRMTSCSDSTTLLKRTSLVIAATTSASPVLPDDPTLLRDKHYLSMGSFKPEMQELPMSLYRLAGWLVIDSDGARQEVGDVINPVREGILSRENVIHLSELVSGARSFDIEGTTVFKGVGLAIYDLFVAQGLYREALRRHIGQTVEL